MPIIYAISQTYATSEPLDRTFFTWPRDEAVGRTVIGLSITVFNTGVCGLHTPESLGFPGPNTSTRRSTKSPRYMPQDDAMKGRSDWLNGSHITGHGEWAYAAPNLDPSSQSPEEPAAFSSDLSSFFFLSLIIEVTPSSFLLVIESQGRVSPGAAGSLG